MFTYKCIIVASIFSLTSVNAFSGECDAILYNGFKNVEESTSSDDRIATLHKRHCETISSTENKEIISQANIEVFGYGEGDADFNLITAKNNLRKWCSDYNQFAQSNQAASRRTETIFQPAVNAWRDCKATLATGLKINTAIGRETNVVTMSVRYDGTSTGGVKFYGVSPQNFKCDTILPNGSRISQLAMNSKGISIGKDETSGEVNSNNSSPYITKNQALNIYCERKTPTSVMEGGSQILRYPAASIVVRTASQNPFIIDFAKKTDPKITKENYDRLFRLYKGLETDYKSILARQTSSERVIFDINEIHLDNECRPTPVLHIDANDFPQIDNNIFAGGLSCPAGYYLNGMKIRRDTFQENDDSKRLNYFSAFQGLCCKVQSNVRDD